MVEFILLGSLNLGWYGIFHPNRREYANNAKIFLRFRSFCENTTSALASQHFLEKFPPTCFPANQPHLIQVLRFDVPLLLRCASFVRRAFTLRLHWGDFFDVPSSLALTRLLRRAFLACIDAPSSTCLPRLHWRNFTLSRRMPPSLSSTCFGLRAFLC